jgi:hypothetical protein
MGRYDDVHLHVEVALGATVDARQTLTPQPKNCARLRTFRNPQLLLTLQGRDFDLRTQRRLGNRYGYIAVKVAASALEIHMFAHSQYDK